MDSFELLVKGLLEVEGYWVQSSFKVDLTKEEKVAIGRPSSPRWEIDLVAYKASSKQILAVECKSFLDSGGVAYDDLFLKKVSTKGRYKLFHEPKLRKIVFNRLLRQLVSLGSVSEDASVSLCLAAAKIFSLEDHELLKAEFNRIGWGLFDTHWIREKLEAAAQRSYEDNIASVVSKILLRSPHIPNPRRRHKLEQLAKTMGRRLPA